MTAKNKKSISLNKELYKSTDQAAYLIHSIIGKDITSIQFKFRHNLLQYLSYLLNVAKKEEQELNWRNNKSSNLINLHNYNKMVTKGIFNPKYKEYGTSKAVHEFIKFLSAKLGDLAFRRVAAGDISVNFANPYASSAQPHMTKSIPVIDFKKIDLNRIMVHAVNHSSPTGYLHKS